MSSRNVYFEESYTVPSDHLTVDQIVSEVKTLYAIKDATDELYRLSDDYFDDAILQNHINTELKQMSYNYSIIYNALTYNAQNTRVEEWIQMNTPVYTPPEDTAFVLMKWNPFEDRKIEEMEPYLGQQDLSVLTSEPGVFDICHVDMDDAMDCYTSILFSNHLW